MKKAIAHHKAADYLDWNEAESLVERLIKDGKKRIALLFSACMFTGLRFSDAIQLTYEDLLSQTITIREKKTGKERVIKVDKELGNITKRCMPGDLFKSDIKAFYVKGKPITIQGYNIALKTFKRRYGLNVENISSHSGRKCYGRRFYEMSGKSDYSLLLLAEDFRHSSALITRRYLGITKSEISSITSNLSGRNL